MNILQKVHDIPNREERRKEAEQIIRSRLNFQGTVMGFSTEGRTVYGGSWSPMMSMPSASSCPFSIRKSGRRTCRGWSRAHWRDRREGAWDLTLANAWGVLAMEKFSKAFEAVPVSGSTRATLSAQSHTTDWNASPKGETSLFSWPTKKEELSVSHQGTGKPWVTVQSLAAIPLKEPFSSGYKIKKTMTPVEQRQPNQWSREISFGFV